MPRHPFLLPAKRHSRPPEGASPTQHSARYGTGTQVATGTAMGCVSSLPDKIRREW